MHIHIEFLNIYTLYMHIDKHCNYHARYGPSLLEQRLKSGPPGKSQYHPISIFSLRCWFIVATSGCAGSNFGAGESRLDIGGHPFLCPQSHDQVFHVKRMFYFTG